MTGDVLTVFSAEILRRLRSPVFKIGIAIGLVAILFLMKLPVLLGGALEGSNRIVIVGDSAIAARAKALLSHDYVVAATLAPQSVTRAMLREHDASAALVLTTSNRGLAVAVYSRAPSGMRRLQIQRDLLPLQLELTMHRSPQEIVAFERFPVDLHMIDSRFTSSAQAQSAQGIAYTLIIFLYLLILTNSQFVMTSVAEEKTSRIAELLVACVEPSALLVGKVAACAVLAMIQLAIWIGAGAFFSSGGAPASLSDNPFSLAGLFDVVTPGVLIAFVLFFVLGFLQLSIVLAALASLINRTEDLGSIAAPIFPLIVAALFVALPALSSPDAGWAVAFSFVPLFAPFVMFARIAVSNVPLWQIITSLSLNAAALWLIAVFGGRLYRVGMLLYGRPPKLSQVFTILRA
jgi:ABC-2 type transport system permease protein